MTTTNLRGINFKIDFGGIDKTGAVITNHSGFFRYKLANSDHPVGIPEDENLYYVLDLKDDKDMLYFKDATLSTFAFPIGLKSREVAISQKYVERYPKYLFGKREGIYPLVKKNTVYKFNTIDGGLINNEPFAMALKILKEKSPAEIIKNKYAVIMIDPFPNKANDMEETNPERDIISVAKGMFKALRNQVMFNQDGILDALEMSNYTKFLIEPVRKIRVRGIMTRAKNDLAAAPFSGFAGFIDKSFRHHDYYLGRQNCQNFLRYHFGIPEEEIEPRLTAIPHVTAFDRFYFNQSPSEENSQKLFPIIPDMRVLKARTNQTDTENFGIDANLNYPPYPIITKTAFEKKYKGLIKKRIESVANALIPNFWFSLANRLFIRQKIYNGIGDIIIQELEDAELIK